jgi:hypothetical protein
VYVWRPRHLDAVLKMLVGSDMTLPERALLEDGRVAAVTE